MEHSTISIEQAQRIIAACQSEGVPCLPRPFSHSNDWFKPLLESGADGLLVQMVNTPEEIKAIIQDLKYAPETDDADIILKNVKLIDQVLCVDD